MTNAMSHLQNIADLVIMSARENARTTAEEQGVKPSDECWYAECNKWFASSIASALDSFDYRNYSLDRPLTDKQSMKVRELCSKQKQY